MADNSEYQRSKGGKRNAFHEKERQLDKLLNFFGLIQKEKRFFDVI
jgi:hypothetical protein